MELWASGFNAWNQLQFEEIDDGDEPEDITTFTKVFSIKGSIRIIETSFSACLGVSDRISKSTEQLKIAGFPDGFLKARLDKLNINDGNEDVQNITCAGNDNIAESTSSTLTLYPNIRSYLTHTPSSNHPIPSISSLVSNSTTLSCLTTTGSIYTWGDARYPLSLGRPITPSTPASQPTHLSSLDSLPTGPIIKLSSGGSITGALTSGHDLYIWSGRPGLPSYIPELDHESESYVDDADGEPVPIDVHGCDVLDFAVGENHMLVLSTEGVVYGIGEGENGQLGLGEERGRCHEWMVLNLPLEEGKKCVAVWAGYKNSFLVVEDI